MGEYSDDEFDDEEPAAAASKPKSPVPFEARPPPGQSPVQLGAMRSPRAPPTIDVKPVQ